MAETFLLGGYTKRTNTGISRIQFDGTTQTFSNSQAIAPLNNPTWVTLSSNQTYLFAIDKEELGGLAVFKKDSNQEYARLTACHATDVPGCHISYHEPSGAVYVSNYHQGSVDIYRFNDETLTFVEQVKHSGSSIHANQQSPHVHMTHFNADETQLYVCDLGTDEVVLYNILPNGTLEKEFVANVPAGTGPRHITFHPTLAIAYVIGELANTVSVFTVADNGHLNLIQTVTTTPETFAATSAGAAIRVTQDGNYLYTSTRFHNIITAYKIETDGTLSLLQQIETGGEIPRDFILNANENYLLIPHQDTDNIIVLKRDAQSGLLSQTDITATAPECVNIVPVMP
ncbi:lactonase family protein [Aerococcaceae bacterium zg-ZUI334]|uniref:lactonase family protein n=1 Tax=Aerococcaceae bacterium zg-252 TaxID=2796928 RepID=UPI001BA30731|nr:lactonase family protein [Aerococcaceae bacterium zg-ZUI334]